jgi:hypothetical protein
MFLMFFSFRLVFFLTLGEYKGEVPPLAVVVKQGTIKNLANQA